MNRQVNMYGRKWFGVLGFAGCLLLFMAVFLSSGIYSKIKNMNGQISMNKVAIRLKENSGLSGGYFNSVDINDLKKLLGTEVITCLAQENGFISHGAKAIKAVVAGTDELAPMFEDIPLIRGSFFSEADCREKSRVVVIDDDIAWKLFNNNDVVGCYVDIFGSQFKITGIIESDRSVIGKLASGGDGSVKAYVPVTALLDVGGGSGVSYIQCKTNPESVIGVIGKDADEMTAALSSIGKDPAGYVIEDYNVKGALMGQKPALLLFFMGLFIILVMSISAVKYIKKIMHDIREECKTDYLSHVAGKYRAAILKIPALLILTGLASIIIWRMIRFGIYIPPDLISDDFNVSHFVDLFYRKAGGAISGDVYSAPFREIRMNTAQAVFNLIFYGGCFGGIALFYTSLVWLKRNKVAMEKALLIYIGFLAADLAVFTLLALFAGLPVMISTNSIILYWSFIFMNLALFLQDGKVLIKDAGTDETLSDNRVCSDDFERQV